MYFISLICVDLGSSGERRQDRKRWIRKSKNAHGKEEQPGGCHSPKLKMIKRDSSLEQVYHTKTNCNFLCLMSLLLYTVKYGWEQQHAQARDIGI